MGAAFLMLLMAAGCWAQYEAAQIAANPDSAYGITSLQITPDRIYPGDQASVTFTIAPLSGSYTHAIVTTSAPFTTGSTKINFDQLSSSNPQRISFTMDIANDTKTGTYPLYVSVSDDKNPSKITATISLVINAPAQTSLLTASAAPEKPVIAGSEIPVSIVLTNTGAIDARDVTVAVVDSSQTFTPLGTDRKYVGTVKAGGTVSVPFTLGVEASAAPGYKALTAKVDYTLDNLQQPQIQQQLGLTIESTPSLVVTSDQTTNADGSVALAVTVANAGDTAVRGVYATVDSRDYRVVGTASKFIGVLNLDDSSTVTFNLVQVAATGAQNFSGGQRPFQAGGQNFTGGARAADNRTAGAGSSVNLHLSFKDPLNQEHTIDQAIQIGGANGAAAARTAFARQTGGIRFLGIDWTIWAGAIVLLVVGYFAYRKYGPGKEKKK
jgi:hypothetical protein